MSSIIFQRTYRLNDDYETIKQRTIEYFDKYPKYLNLIKFNGLDRSVTFSSEKLIPKQSTNKPRVMLLFSNPHPHSVYQGMFLSPNTRGRENDFWPVMEVAGWLAIPKENRNPKQLAEICLKAEYPGPFELIFYCYYAFPTKDPTHIRKMFGEEFFNQEITPKAADEFLKTIQETSVEAVVTFNKEIYNLVSKDHIDTYIEHLKEGELIRSRIIGIDRYVPIFQTFPTGFWRCPRQFRKASLEEIRTAICSELNVPKSEPK